MLGHLLNVAASGLQYLAMPFLWVGWLATPILWASDWCLYRAREWNPRLWDRTGGRTPNETRD